MIDVGAPNGNNNKAQFSVTSSTAERLVLTVATDQPVRILYEAPNSQAILTIPAK